MIKLKNFNTTLITVLLLTGLLAGRIALAVPVSQTPETLDEFKITPFLMQSADYSEALSLLKENEYEKVINLGKQYVGSNPQDPQAHLIMILGWIGLEQQKSIDAHLYELNLRLPEVANAIKFNMAKYYASKDKYKQALDYLPKNPAAKDKLKTMHLQALIYIQSGKKDEALAAYQSILKQAPNDEPSMLKLATLYLSDKNYNESVRYARKLIALKPNSASALVILGTNQLLLNQPERAVNTFKKVTSLQPKSAVGILNLATAYHALKRYEDAQRIYEKLARTYPDIQEGHTGLALAYLAQDNVTKSRRAAKRAIAVNPKYSIPHLIVAAAALSENDIASANLAFKNTGDIFIDFQRPRFDASSYFRHQPLATVSTLANSVFFSQQGYLEMALQASSGTVNDVKQAPFVAITRARASWKMGQTDKAQSILQNVSRNFPELVTPVIESADISFFTDKQKTALANYQKAMQIAPELTVLHMNLGNLYNALGDPDNAVSQYKQYLKKNPRSTEALNQIAATISEVQNMPEKALPFALDAQKIEPESLQVKDTLGDIYFRLGRFQESLKQYEAVAAAAKSVNPKTYYRIGLNYLNLKDTENAEIFIERAVSIGVDFPLRDEAVKKLKQLKNSRA